MVDVKSQLRLDIKVIVTKTYYIVMNRQEEMEFTLRDNTTTTSTEPEQEDDVPQLLHLQLPTSLLSNFSKQSCLLLNREELVQQQRKDDGDEQTSLTITLATDGNDRNPQQRHERYMLQKEHNDDCTREWYQSTPTANNKKEMHKIGTTNKCYKLDPNSIVDLKKIGEKTRRLLEQENKKRKEIVRLGEGECILPPNVVGNVVAEKKEKLPSRQKKATTKPVRKKRRIVDPNVDGWFPDTDDLVGKAVSKDDHSNIVRLHGLPVGIKPEHIRKFFQGLNPSLIFVLPSNNATSIEGWDVQNANDNAVARRVKVDRYPSVFRVFVKFQSALVADAAIERSGEWIGLDKESEFCDDQDGIKGATISVSPVSKRISSYLQKNMAIHCSKVGISIAETMSTIEQQLGDIVTDMAWIMASKKLSIKHTSTKKELTILQKAHIYPLNVSEYESSVTIYNAMIDLHEKIETDFGSAMTHTFDLSCLQDSAHRITQSVSNWILDEIELIGNLLKESRHANNYWAVAGVSQKVGILI